MKGTCLCGRATVEVPHAPDYINFCNCRFCRSFGAAWGYFTTDEVAVSGETRSYRREDLGDPWLEAHACATCSTTTHYTYTQAHPRDRVGVNMRLFVQDELAGVPVKWQDGRKVAEDSDQFIVTGRGHIGDGKAFNRKSSFAPVVAPDTRVLILGSLPGEQSLAAQRYYAHPRNRFWHLIGTVIGRDLEALDYDARLSALLEGKVGLWDTVASASRSGSLDAAIREADPNPLADLASSLPDLRAVGFNGATAARIGTGQLAGARLALIALPSSSPANASIPLATKEERWRALGEFLR